jgi:hypothetical protein
VVLVCGLLACTSPTDHTQHLEIEAHLDMPLCAGNLARYESMIEAHEDRLGRDLHTPVALELWPAPEWYDLEWRKCDPHLLTGGCYARASHHIFAAFDDRSIAHSLVHAIARNRDVDDRLFVEGTAEALSQATTFPLIAPTLGVAADNINLASAGHFVRWLWETRGPACTRAMLWTDESDAVARFESACGSTFEAARDEFAASAPFYYPSPFGCGETDWVLADALDETLEFECDDPEVRAVEFRDELWRETTRVIEVETAGLHHVWTSAPRATLASCTRVPVDAAPAFRELGPRELPPDWANAPWSESERTLEGGAVALLELPAGRLELVVMTTTEVLEQRVVITPADPALPLGLP